MPGNSGKRLIWLVVIVVLILIVVQFMLPGTHPPPFTRIGGATPEQLAATCNDPDLHFVGLLGREAEVDTGVFVRLSPEYRSFKNDPEDLKQGRVVALIQLRRGAGFKAFGLKDTAAACLFISGEFPNGLVTAVISKKGELLADSLKTTVVPKLHLLPEAHWEADSAVREGFNPWPSPLYAESPETMRLASGRAAWWTRAVKAVMKASGQTSCTNHSCCISSGGH
jgi:hypothetical protein